MIRRGITGPAATAVLVLGLAALRPRRVAVTGVSMAPTLVPGDRLLALRSWRVLPGDLAVVPDPRRADRLLVKRVARLAGDAVVLTGDNPDHSTDSRSFGVVPRSAVRGRVTYRYAPPERVGRVR